MEVVVRTYISKTAGLQGKYIEFIFGSECGSTTIALQKAEAELAYELQAAKTKQRIKEEQMQILVVERSQEIAVQDQEIQRRERELEATIRRPAEAEKYKYD